MTAFIAQNFVPLLFAGLLLGRTGVWATMACYMPILCVGVGAHLKLTQAAR